MSCQGLIYLLGLIFKETWYMWVLTFSCSIEKIIIMGTHVCLALLLFYIFRKYWEKSKYFKSNLIWKVKGIEMMTKEEQNIRRSYMIVWIVRILGKERI